MFGTRRLAKRSIIGTRVSAPLQDGRYFPGVIQSTQTNSNGAELYTVGFDDGYTAVFTEKNIVGPGFQPVSAANLQPMQKVFITYNGREFSGVVESPESDDELKINVVVPDGPDFQLTRKIEDVRLLESRRSARLQDQDTDYSRLLDMHPEPKKRTVSSVIDVPGPAPKQSRRRRLPRAEEDMMEDDDDAEDEDDEDSPAVMDEHTAAMVLTNLSCSPVSPMMPSSFSFSDRVSENHLSSSVNSSGVFTFKSESGTPSPPQQLAGSAPTVPMFGNHVSDEGIEMDLGLPEEGSTQNKEYHARTRTVFKCTWKGCSKVHLSVSAIENHVRTAHLGPKKEDEEEFSDHEEEFYYTEEEVSVDSMTQTFADMYTSSPPSTSHINAARSLIQDHDYQKKGHRTLPQSIPQAPTQVAASFPTQLQLPMDIPQLTKSLSWQHDYTSSSFPGTSHSSQMRNKQQDRLHQHQLHSPKIHHMASSPKTSPGHKKPRSEIKKCRKVYGMENRDMWCTQCKWKKACTRFLD